MRHSRNRGSWKNYRLRNLLLDCFLPSMDLKGKFLPVRFFRDFLLESVLKCSQLSASGVLT